MRNKTLLWIFFISLAALVVVLLYALWPAFRDVLEHGFTLLLRANPTAIKAYLLGFGIWAPLVSALLMLLQAIIAPLPASVIIAANGLLFGPWWGALLSWGTSLLAALMAFAIPRVLGRPLVEKLVSHQRLEQVDGFFKRFGRHAILLSRLMPIMPFDVVSYAAGLTAMDPWDFVLATGIGQLPGILIYSFLGHSTTQSGRWLLWGLVAVLALVTTAYVAKIYFDHRSKPPAI